MTHQQHRFQTNGSNALKAEELEFDVFVKPQFLSERSKASIIDFDDARQMSDLSQPAINRSRLSGRSKYTRSPRQTSFSQQLISNIKTNRILGDLFTQQNKNTYRRSDLVTFAKGFSVTGLATFIMILFGA